MVLFFWLFYFLKDCPPDFFLAILENGVFSDSSQGTVARIVGSGYR